ncbi:MAG: DUF3572 domain-containing protein [Beijerinckiaceae bacterium]|jgi:hypothetical protein|nr:DUF3572 domain-containing protein [Beijerinckiaceae bacterium]
MASRIGHPDAEDIAIRALGFLASDPERLDRFLSFTGLGPENLRAAAGTPGFLASVLDHVVNDESLLMALAGNLGLPPETVARAHRAIAAPVHFED